MSITKLISFTNPQSFKSLAQVSPIFARSCLKPVLPLIDPLNANSTLSNIQKIQTKSMFYQNYKKLNPKLREIKVFYKFCVMFLQFYKDGIKDVYNNYKTVRLLRKGYYHNNKDIVPGMKNQYEQIKYQNTTQLIKQLSNTVGNFQNEFKLTKDIGKMFNSIHDISITRSQWHTILRTSNDIYKLPLFGLLFLLLEELTVLLCYLIPDLTPSTCLIPQLTSRFYQSASQAQKQLHDMGDLSHKTPFSLSKEQLVTFIDALQLKSRYIPVVFYTEDRLRDLLQLRIQEIKIDNFFILRDGGVWNLSKLELINACLQRGLLDLEKFITLSKSNSLNFYDLVDEKILQLKLFKHINDSYLEGVSNLALIKPIHLETELNIDDLILSLNSVNSTYDTRRG